MTTRNFWTHKIILSGALLFSTTMLMATTPETMPIEQQKESNPHTQNAPFYEQEKWNYLREKININNKNCTTLINKFGSLIKKYSNFLTLPVGVAATSICAHKIGLFLVKTNDHYEYPSNNPHIFYQRLAITMAVGTLSWMVADLITENTGEWIEATPRTCLKTLTTFFSQWQTHKNNVPTTILPQLEKLNADFNAQKNSFRTLTKEQAVKIIKNIIIVSHIFGEQYNIDLA